MTKLAHNPALLFLDTKKNDLPNVQIQLFEFDNEHACSCVCKSEKSAIFGKSFHLIDSSAKLYL